MKLKEYREADAISGGQLFSLPVIFWRLNDLLPGDSGVAESELFEADDERLIQLGEARIRELNDGASEDPDFPGEKERLEKIIGEAKETAKRELESRERREMGKPR